MLSIISLLYKRNYVTVRIICNISNACKHLNIGCTSLIHFWIGTAGCMVNMQQFMKATSILAVGSHSMIEYAIQFLFMNMECKKKEHYFKCSFWHCSISPCKYSSLTEQSKVLAVEDFLKSILYRFISFL
mgnify:FL=1